MLYNLNINIEKLWREATSYTKVARLGDKFNNFMLHVILFLNSKVEND